MCNFRFVSARERGSMAIAQRAIDFFIKNSLLLLPRVSPPSVSLSTIFSRNLIINQWCFYRRTTLKYACPANGVRFLLFNNLGAFYYSPRQRGWRVHDNTELNSRFSRISTKNCAPSWSVICSIYVKCVTVFYTEKGVFGIRNYNRIVKDL